MKSQKEIDGVLEGLFALAHETNDEAAKLGVYISMDLKSLTIQKIHVLNKEGVPKLTDALKLVQHSMVREARNNPEVVNSFNILIDYYLEELRIADANTIKQLH